MLRRKEFSFQRWSVTVTHNCSKFLITFSLIQNRFSFLCSIPTRSIFDWIGIKTNLALKKSSFCEISVEFHLFFRVVPRFSNLTFRFWSVETLGISTTKPELTYKSKLLILFYNFDVNSEEICIVKPIFKIRFIYHAL